MGFQGSSAPAGRCRTSRGNEIHKAETLTHIPNIRYDNMDETFKSLVREGSACFARRRVFMHRSRFSRKRRSHEKQTR